MAAREEVDQTARVAVMLAALGTEPRLRILRLLLSAHPEGMVVGDIQAELGIPASTLSHLLERLRTVELLLLIDCHGGDASKSMCATVAIGLAIAFALGSRQLNEPNA